MTAPVYTHVFLAPDHTDSERRTWMVIGLCAAMMAVEIAGGNLLGSVALIADGLHMSTHVAAFLIAALAYSYARRHAEDPRFSFGTGKLGDLAGFSSAIVLAMIAVLIACESVDRFFHPVAIRYEEAMLIAALGLAVNIASALLLGGGTDHDHGHGHGYGHGHEHGDTAPDAGIHRDNNMRAALVHVIADAAVSVLVLAGLAAGRVFGWRWIDPMVGLAGAGVIANWAYGLIRNTGAILLDMTPDRALAAKLRRMVEERGDTVADLHLWRLGPGHLGAIVSVITHAPTLAAKAETYRAQLSGLPGLSHVTVEVLAAD